MTTTSQPLSSESIARVGSLRNQVSEALRAALISGQLRPGSVYSAPVLGDMLGVSATPVREAMLDLVREGLVETLRNKGFRIAELSDRQLDNFAHVRVLLEVPLMGEVASRAGEASVRERLERLGDRASEMTRAAAAEDLVEFIRLDTDFHADFLALAGNEEAVKIVRDLRNRSRLYGLEGIARAGLLDQTCAEHHQMVELGIAGDRPGLEALTAVHIGHVRTLWANTSL